MDYKNEILNKAKIAAVDFENLCRQGVIGFYESCEVTQIFLIEKSSKKIFNYYTLIVFEESDEVGSQPIFLTDKPLSVNERFQLGITQTRITVSQTQSLFQEIQKNKFTLNSEPCEIGKELVLLPKQFIPSFWDGSKIPMDNILKPNYWGDSYVIEFFCEDKPLIKNLNEKDIHTINHYISSNSSISIDLTKIYERTENIIFQFPVTLLAHDDTSAENESLKETIYTHPKITEPIDLLITAKTSTDKNVTGFFNQKTKSDQTPIILPLGDSDNVELTIAKADSSIILHHSLFNYMRSLSGSMNIHDDSKPRDIIDKDGKKHSIELVTPFLLSVNIRKDDFFQQINQRKIENGLIKKSGDCQVFKNGNQKQAYEFVKKLVQKHSQDSKEICLWDPYLTASDIIETLYFENTGKPFRCITSLGKAKQIDKKTRLHKAAEKNIEELTKKSISAKLVAKFRYSSLHEVTHDTIIGRFSRLLRRGLSRFSSHTTVSGDALNFEHFKKDQMNYFQSRSNNLRVHLDFRCQHADYGAPFHDRFLIFVPNDAHDLPKTYSLGTSVNTLGQKHHIIQKTADARLILQNFNELWEALPPDACRIVLFPKDLQ